MVKPLEEGEFPSVELAYPIAVAAYEVALKRLDTMDGRLQTIVAFVVSVFGGFVSFATTSGLHFRSWLFALATLLCIAATALGIFARLHGKVLMLVPSNLYSEWLTDDHWTFKKDMIYRSGLAFDENMDLVTWKWKISVFVTVFLALEVAALTAWILASRL